MPTLTRAEAAERSALLTVHSYQVDLDLTTGPDSFRSATTVRFDARAPEAATFVEIRPGELISAELNGHLADLAGFCDGRLPRRGLAASNELIITAEMPYSHESVGLHRYVDPADGETYLYGLCAPAAAPHIFACFDQPDLKASLSFSVTVPEGWQVLGTGAATMLGPGRWELTATPPLATYLATIVAGPYQSFRAEHDGIPLGLHARRSLADALAADAKEFFTFIAQCLDEYHRLFGVRYPFGKYDQVFVPEFGVQAMEIPACVVSSHYPIAGSVFQWTKYLAHRTYAWFSGWTYLFAGILTVTAVVATLPLALIPAINGLPTLFGGKEWAISPSLHAQLVAALITLVVITVLNIYGVRLLELLAKLPVETHLVITRAAELTLALETDLKAAAVRRLPASTGKVTVEFLLKRFVDAARRPPLERHLEWFGALGPDAETVAALAARLDKLDYNTYVLLGDGEIAEGSVWEAASIAGIYKLNNLIAIVDANRLGQSEAIFRRALEDDAHATLKVETELDAIRKVLPDLCPGGGELRHADHTENANE